MSMVSNLLELPEIKYIHFTGIGGISMSGLAEILLSFGYRISGSDIKSTNITKKLSDLGVEFHAFHSEENVKDQDLLVHTAAVKENNPEIIKAKKLGIPVIDRASLLGQIMRRYPYSIAVSGTHGKTTTTSMISTIMIKSGKNPTIHIGGELDIIGGNTKVGGNKYFITEACEYVESFLKFNPFLGIILNIDLDHVDYFRDLEHIKEAFLKFARLIPEDGYLVACMDDPNAASLIDKVNCNRITYGIKSTSPVWSVDNIIFDGLGCASFNILKDRRVLCNVKLSVPGIHNVSNALAAAAACSVAGCETADIKEGLEKFKGARRRFELKGTVNNIKVIDDYAHHPAEIKATLKAAKNCRHERIWCVFQPHTYTRTKLLLDEFSTAFNDADTVIVSDIYAARETDTGEIHSTALVERINLHSGNAVYKHGFDAIVEYLAGNVLQGDLIITMGAGDIYKVGEMFLKESGKTASTFLRQPWQT